MAVIVKTECQTCADIRQEECDGVLVFAFRKNEDGGTSFFYWGHHITPREVMINFLNYTQDKVEELAEESGMTPLELLTYVLHHAKFSLED